jgi:hypothetical protein
LPSIPVREKSWAVVSAMAAVLAKMRAKRVRKICLMLV